MEKRGGEEGKGAEGRGSNLRYGLGGGRPEISPPRSFLKVGAYGSSNNGGGGVCLRCRRRVGCGEQWRAAAGPTAASQPSRRRCHGVYTVSGKKGLGTNSI